MRGRTRIRLLAAGAVVVTAALAFGQRPALAATQADTATWTAVELGGSPLSCDAGGPALSEWSCQTSAPIVAGGLTCVQTTHTDVDAQSVTVGRTGCTASLSIPAGSWGISVANCNLGYPVGAGCQAAATGGAGLFSFQPVQPGLGPSITNLLATFTDAACDDTGGHATVESIDTADGLVMEGAIAWVGSCITVSDLTWTANLTAI